MCANLGIQLILIYYREKKERYGEEEMERNERVAFLKTVSIYFSIHLNHASCFWQCMYCIWSGIEILQTTEENTDLWFMLSSIVYTENTYRFIIYNIQVFISYLNNFTTFGDAVLAPLFTCKFYRQRG